ncbi:hypothetical protein ACVWXO_008048 [Bradyrhizobium sp. LM2.7]
MSLAATHNNCLKLALALLAASRDSQKKKSGHDSRGWDMLDAIQISVALWAMIVCGGIKVVQVLPCLF